MTTVRTEADARAEIRARLDDWADAIRAKDVDAIMAGCAPELLAFDCHGPLRMKGADAYRRHLEACLPCMPGPMTLKIHDLEITAQEDVGFCHYLARCGGTGPDGTEHSSWFRATTCLRRIGGTWQIVHAHLSAPFDPGSMNASLDLRP